MKDYKLKLRNLHASKTLGWSDVVASVLQSVKFICSRLKKRRKPRAKTCHAKTMLSLEKPIKLLYKTPHMCRLGKSPRSKYEGRS